MVVFIMKFKESDGQGSSEASKIEESDVQRSSDVYRSSDASEMQTVEDESFN